MRLLWLGLVALALSALPGINYLIYAVGPNLIFQVNPMYIEVGSNRYYIFTLPSFTKYIIFIIIMIIIGYYELRKSVRPRHGSLFVGVLAVVISAPLPLIFAERDGLILVVLSNAFSSAGPLLLLIAGILELAEHYILPGRTTEIIATPESAMEKTEKA